jgi:regulator of protease activity HflC (stomatin/prohibitin superfamily)
MVPTSAGLLVALVIVVFVIAHCSRSSRYERGVVFRLGRRARWTTGREFLPWFRSRTGWCASRATVVTAYPQDIITRDNVPVKVSAVVYYRVMNPRRAVIDVENFHCATSQLSQTRCGRCSGRWPDTHFSGGTS